MWKVSIVNFGMEFPSVAETHLNLLPHTLFTGLRNETTVLKQSQVVSVANLEESPTIVDHSVAHFAADGTSLSRWQIFVVEEVVLDQLSVLHVARVVDEMRSLAATANNIILIWLLNSGNVGLGFGWGDMMMHGGRM